MDVTSRFFFLSNVYELRHWGKLGHERGTTRNV